MLTGFLRRHPDILLRKPEATSAARALGFNDVAVSKLFDLLTQVIDEHQLTPDKIYNVDETGISAIPKVSQELLHRKDDVKLEL